MFLHVIVLGGIPIESDLRSRLGTIWEQPKFKVELWCRGRFGRLGWIDRAVNELSHAGSWDVVDTSARSLAILAVLVGIALFDWMWLSMQQLAKKRRCVPSTSNFFYHFRQDFFNEWARGICAKRFASGFSFLTPLKTIQSERVSCKITWNYISMFDEHLRSNLHRSVFLRVLVPLCRLPWSIWPDQFELPRFDPWYIILNPFRIVHVLACLKQLTISLCADTPVDENTVEQ